MDHRNLPTKVNLDRLVHSVNEKTILVMKILDTTPSATDLTLQFHLFYTNEKSSMMMAKMTKNDDNMTVDGHSKM